LVPITFEVSGHKLALDTFIKTSQQYERLLEAMNSEIFGDDLQLKVYILPPKAGSFKTSLGVVAIAGFGAMVGPVLGDLGGGILEGLAGKSAKELGQQMGDGIRESI